MSNERPLPLVSVHLPKAAGSSMGKFLLDAHAYELDKVYLYDTESRMFHRADKDGLMARNRPYIFWARDYLIRTDLGRRIFHRVLKEHQGKRKATGVHKLPDDFVVAHGHINLETFGERTDVAYRLVTVVREPLERTLSHKRFLEKYAAGGFKVPVWFTPGMPFEEFAMLPQMVNYQSNFLKKPLGEIDIVGITSELECLCRFLEPDTKVAVPQNLNHTRRFDIKLDEGFVERFRLANSADYELYREAQLRAQELKK